MAVTSTMIPLGTVAPDFELRDVSTDQSVTRDSFSQRAALLVAFICRHCPYVQHVKMELSALGHDYLPAGVGMVAISSNDAHAYPEDSPESLKEFAAEIGLTYPLCYDESQAVARAYSAACTPDFFLFDGAHRLVYRGQLDDSRPGNGRPVTGADLRAAIDAVLGGRPVAVEQRPSVGCGIKWRDE